MEMLSGLWHHAHDRGHPFMNTEVRIPGPSSVDIRIICNTVPAIVSVVTCSAIVPLKPVVAHPLDDLVLEFLAHGNEIGVVPGNAHQEVPVVLWVLLGVPEHVRVEHVNL